jgi:hypothetical protein
VTDPIRPHGRPSSSFPAPLGPRDLGPRSTARPGETPGAGGAFAERLREARAAAEPRGPAPSPSPAPGHAATSPGAAAATTGGTAAPAAAVRPTPIGSGTPGAPPAGSSSPPSRDSLGPAVARAVQRLVDGGRYVDAALRAARRGELGNEQLLAIQAGVYRYTQELELAAKVVDKTTSGIKQVLQSQQ